MTRQSISLTPPNDEWLKQQVASEEFANKSEVVNTLIRKAREREEQTALIKARLIQSEQSGYSTLSPQEILAKSKDALKRNGEL